MLKPHGLFSSLRGASVDGMVGPECSVLLWVMQRRERKVEDCGGWRLFVALPSAL